ncbi:hypothetical protein DFS34DRAFT_663888 [Phlyctochytrium arcticum]|nr:hypothetical protein DFS34DRAFT_663888 [Phlyctochytrium arcticum]
MIHQYVLIDGAKEDDISMVPLECRTAFYAEVLEKISEKALELVQEQLVLADKEGSNPVCNRNFSRSMGVPCYHILNEIKADGLALRLSDFHPHWRLETRRATQTSQDVESPEAFLTNLLAAVLNSFVGNAVQENVDKDTSSSKESSSDSSTDASSSDSTDSSDPDTDSDSESSDSDTDSDSEENNGYDKHGYDNDGYDDDFGESHQGINEDLEFPFGDYHRPGDPPPIETAIPVLYNGAANLLWRRIFSNLQACKDFILLGGEHTFHIERWCHEYGCVNGGGMWGTWVAEERVAWYKHVMAHGEPMEVSGHSKPLTIAPGVVSG